MTSFILFCLLLVLFALIMPPRRPEFKKIKRPVDTNRIIAIYILWFGAAAMIGAFIWIVLLMIEHWG